MQNREKSDRKTSNNLSRYNTERRIRSWLWFFRFMLTVIVLIVCIFLWKGMRLQVELDSFTFTESSRELKNPNRGFYSLYSFFITEEEVDYRKLIKEKYQKDTELTQVQICLREYREKPISEKGLANIEALLSAVEVLDKQLIVRFMYDDNGQGELHEPESLDIILQHMRQLEPILKKPGRKIFIVQGLFTGSWGEMNGTRYDTDGDLQRLSAQLAAVTESSTYLGVRIPAQWRRIMSSEELKEVLDGRLCLFNDGMLGNESDFGTYRPENVVGEDPLQRKYPEEEIDFQKELCRTVPNGGEVINNNPYNDFENAVAGLKDRRVTYLNKDYDQNVMQKWKNAVWQAEDCFRGMDGYNYIERHLGYRLVITDVNLQHDQKKNSIDITVDLKNVGFAPMYKSPKIQVILYSRKDGQRPPVDMECNDIQKLVGEDENETTAYATMPIEELDKGEYEMYFRMEDSDTGNPILMANEEEEKEYGYLIGTINLHNSNIIFEMWED